jgi:histidinol-phosphate/aromatic aminotransferase/cobyric acid decarboxylase-like protein
VAVARELYVSHRILVKHCAGKTMANGDQYLRIGSRTLPENERLVEALGQVLTRLVARR